MELEYKAYRERRAQRIKIASIFAICWIPYGLLGIWAYFNTEVFGFLVLIGIFGFLLSHSYINSHYWISEPSEKIIFMNLYRSSELIGLCAEKNDEESKLYLGKAVKHVKNVISELDKMCAAENINSILFDKEFVSRLEKLADNLQHRILPRIVKSKDLPRIISVLHGLAKFFGEIQKPMSLNELDSINENLETYKEMPFRERAIKPIFKKALVSRPSQLIFSVFLGYLTITVVVWIFSQFLTMDFVEIMQSNIIGVVTGGAVLTGAIASLFRLKK